MVFRIEWTKGVGSDVNVILTETLDEEQMYGFILAFMMSPIYIEGDLCSILRIYKDNERIHVDSWTDAREFMIMAQGG